MVLLLVVQSLISGCRVVRQQLDAYLTAAHEHWGFEGAVAVAVNGQVILSRGYGLASQIVPEPNGPQTKFMIGSITKQFTAAAILVLEERGLVQLHVPIKYYLPELPPDKGERITIHHLLTHTSGLWEYTTDPEVLLRRTQPFRADGLLERIAREPLVSSPGSCFKYSNSGYIVLGAIIERVTGQSYEAFLHAAIFKPAGMLNTGYARREAGLPQRADGYTQQADGGLVDALPIHFSVLHSAGALYSTVEDMLRWDSLLSTELILSRKSIRLMFTQAAADYAYGWATAVKFGRYHLHHDGFMDGFSCTYERWPCDRLSVLVFSNDDDAPVKKIAHGLAALLFREPHDTPATRPAVDLAPETLQHYEGVYQLPGVEQYQVIRAEDGRLFTYRYGEPRDQLLAAGPDTCFYAIDNSRTVTFIRDKFGVVIGLELYDDGDITVAYRAEPSTSRIITRRPPPAELSTAACRRLEGTFLLESPTDSPFLLSIACRGEHIIARANNTDVMELWPASDTVFFDPNGDLILTIHLGEAAYAIGCTIQLGSETVTGVLSPEP